MFENMFEKALVLQYFWTNLGPILVKLIVEHIIHPKIANLGFLNLGPILSS